MKRYLCLVILLVIGSINLFAQLSEADDMPLEFKKYNNNTWETKTVWRLEWSVEWLNNIRANFGKEAERYTGYFPTCDECEKGRQYLVSRGTAAEYHKCIEMSNPKFRPSREQREIESDQREVDPETAKRNLADAVLGQLHTPRLLNDELALKNYSKLTGRYIDLMQKEKAVSSDAGSFSNSYPIANEISESIKNNSPKMLDKANYNDKIEERIRELNKEKEEIQKRMRILTEKYAGITEKFDVDTDIFEKIDKNKNEIIINWILDMILTRFDDAVKNRKIDPLNTKAKKILLADERIVKRLNDAKLSNDLGKLLDEEELKKVIDGVLQLLEIAGNKIPTGTKYIIASTKLIAGLSSELRDECITWIRQGKYYSSMNDLNAERILLRHELMNINAEKDYLISHKSQLLDSDKKSGNELDKYFDQAKRCRIKVPPPCPMY